MAAAAVILVAIALLIFTSTTTLHHQVQGAAGEYVLLEAMPEWLAPAAEPKGVVVNSTRNLMCGSCKCCRRNSNPESCLRTCCYYKACDWSGCELQFASCGCRDCGYPAVAN